MDRRSNSRVINLEIYTDGSLKRSGKLTFGGWAFIAIRGGEEIYYANAGENNTTNQRMELTAIKNALEYASSVRRGSERVIIYSDSAYAINCYLQEWYVKWQSNGWVNYKGEDVANKDLWFEIIPYFDNYWYDFRKVEGHSNNYWNNRCDVLAQQSADYMKKHWSGYNNL